MGSKSSENSWRDTTEVLYTLVSATNNGIRCPARLTTKHLNALHKNTLWPHSDNYFQKGSISCQNSWHNTNPWHCRPWSRTTSCNDHVLGTSVKPLDCLCQDLVGKNRKTLCRKDLPSRAWHYPCICTCRSMDPACLRFRTFARTCSQTHPRPAQVESRRLGNCCIQPPSQASARPRSTPQSPHSSGIRKSA